MTTADPMTSSSKMTTAKKNGKWIMVAGMLILIPLIIFGGFGAYGLYQTDKLPFQAQPTRIPITPVELPSFGTIGGTPAPATNVEPTPAA